MSAGALRLIRPEARYEAGYPTDYNPAPPVAQSADSEIYSAGYRLRDWARYLAKNSSIIKAILDSRTTKGIGCGLRYTPMVRDRQGRLLEKLNTAIGKIHEDWSKAVDVTGELSRAELERAVWRDWDTAGEVFIRKVYRGRNAERVGYQLQAIPSELVPYGWVSDRGAVMGIDRDEWGAPLRYWVYPYAPSSYMWRYAAQAMVPAPIPAGNMIHLRRQGELGATRGITLFHAVILRVSDISNYQESHRRAARASANLFAARNRAMDFVPDADDVPPEYMGSTQPELNLSELQILEQRPGETLSFNTPAHPNQSAVDFVNQEYRQIAACCRVAFSWIAYVFDRAYAAQRVEHVHAWEFIYEDRAHFVRDFALPALYEEPLKIALLEGRLPARELRRADPRTLYAVRIEGPVMASIDPESDRKSAQIDQEQGWESRQGNIRRFNRDPVQVDAERAEDTFVQPTAAAPKQARAAPKQAETEDEEEDRSPDTAEEEA